METIRCRIKRSYWWMVPLGALETVFMAVSPFFMAKELPPFSSPWPIYLICGPAALGFGYCVLWMVRSLLFEEIAAGEEGLRWRGVFGPWKNARWEEISDFYLEKWKGTPTVATPQGKITLSSGLANKPEMMALVAARAVNAPARTWEMERLRGHQMVSKRFDYWTKSQKWFAPVFCGLEGAGILAFIVLTLFSPGSKVPRAPLEPSWAFFWLPLLLGIAFVIALAILFVPMLHTIWGDRNYASRHRAEHLEISPRGLAWQNGENRIEASWDEVRAIRPMPLPASGLIHGFKRDYRVETQNGDFTVHKELETLGLWLQLARQFAPQLAPEPASTDPDLGGEAATWSGSEVGVGARIFHFRTRDTRLTLWAATAFGLILTLLPVLMHLTKTPDDEPSPFPWKLFAAVLFFVVSALFYGWLCFRRAVIWADETGLEWRVPLFKTRRVAWSEIESFGSDESGFFLRTRAQKRKLWQSFTPVRQNELLQLIAERATNASGKWDSI